MDRKAQIVLAIILLLTTSAVASERQYQEQWCADHGGQVEVTLPDKTRCDCLTKTHSIEMDWAPKWYEAVGQSLYYSLQTGKKAGIVLIIKSEAERKYWIRLNSTIEHFDLPIDTWKIKLAR